MKYTINELANSKGVSPLVREALLHMEAELEATNRQVEILSDALAESRREVAAQSAPVQMAHIVGEIDHTGKVWTPAQPAPVQPVQPVALTYKEVANAMNALWGGTLEQVQIAMEMADKRLYTAPPAQPAPVPLTDEQTTDKDRINWLNNNFFNRENVDWLTGNVSQESLMWVFFAPTNVQGDIRRVIDAAMEAPQQWVREAR